jgi:hypothetical protein
MKTMITPGRLYAQLSREFREACCGRCASCILPPPHPVHDLAGDGPNWALGELPNTCDECLEELESIVRRHQERYDLLDPISPRMPQPPHSAFRFPLPASRLN